MHHTSHRPGRPCLPAVLLAATALALAGCGADDATPDPAAGADDTTASQDGDPGGEIDDDGGGDGSGEASWIGDELAIERVSCTTGRPEPDLYQIRGSGDGFDLTAQMLIDTGASDGDDVVLAGPKVDVELILQGEGGTIGDAEQYSSGRSDDDGSGLESDVGGVSGTVELGPQLSSEPAAEANPDGGLLELDLRC